MKLVKANIFDQDWVDGLESVLRSIIDDGTGDIDNPKKRLWPIRAANYRKAAKLLEEYPKVRATKKINQKPVARGIS